MIGIDIVYIPRFQSLIEGTNSTKLIQSIFSESELQQCKNKNDEARLQSLAARYAAKEAVIKASKGRLNISDLKNITIIQYPQGYLESIVHFKDGTESYYEISISHDGEYAVGVAKEK